MGMKEIGVDKSDDKEPKKKRDDKRSVKSKEENAKESSEKI